MTAIVAVPEPVSHAPSKAVQLLTEEQVVKVEELKTAVAELVQSSEALQHYCTDMTYVRYLRARDWNVGKATKMLTATLEWRLSFKPEAITWDEVKKEAETGKIFRLPKPDKHGRVVLMLRSRHENSRDHDMQLKHVVYHMERACQAADALGSGKMTWFVDYEGYSMRNAPPVRQSLRVLSVLQNHYPERLGEAIMYHSPGIFSFFWKAIKPFIDPVTYSKITFINANSKDERALLDSRFHLDSLETCVGGEYAGTMYNFEEYGEQMKAEEAAHHAPVLHLTVQCES